jgi:translation initiation factor 2 subunit 3
MEMIQPQINIGLVGHVDHGKTTLTKLLSGVWTDTHSEEIKRGITIKLGYTNFIIYKNKDKFSVKKEEDNKEVKRYSIVDSPGHESFMATMISGASVMDYALLLIDASENCPQPQTIEHLKALEISGIRKIIIVQNKIDLVEKEEAIKNYEQIEEFLKTTKFDNSPIIPLSARYGANISVLLEFIHNEFVDIKKDDTSKTIFNIVRSFDCNKPGTDYSQISGGILGISIKSGTLSIGDEIEIKPGILKLELGKKIFKPIYAKVLGLKTDKTSIEKAYPGGSIGILTGLDPNMTKSNCLVGQIGGIKETLQDINEEINFSVNLFDEIIVNNKNVSVKPLIPNEPLMLIVNSFTTAGIVMKTNLKEATMKLKRPVMVFPDDKLVIFRQIEKKKWKIIGYGNIL